METFTKNLIKATQQQISDIENGYCESFIIKSFTLAHSLLEKYQDLDMVQEAMFELPVKNETFACNAKLLIDNIQSYPWFANDIDGLVILLQDIVYDYMKNHFIEMYGEDDMDAIEYILSLYTFTIEVEEHEDQKR